jgi:hypothetical protein
MPQHDIEQILTTLPRGKIWGMVGRNRTCLVRRVADGWEIDLAWVVPEAYDDDPDVCAYHPFKINKEWRNPVPWVGRRVHAGTATDAAELYAMLKEQLCAGQPIQSGIVIGSVVR